MAVISFINFTYAPKAIIIKAKEKINVFFNKKPNFAWRGFDKQKAY